MPKEKKSNDRTMQDRIKEMLSLVTKMSRNELIQHFQKWNLSDRQIDNYISQCNKILKSEFEKFMPNAAAYIYNNRLEIYKQALCNDDFVIARGILSDLAKMTGADTTSVDLTSKGKSITGFTITIANENTFDD
ncbi:MAG: hypothetical protein FWG98_06780 [Candidatus Cloacimonetes bacterium]|nr:hypothetical protein [Candidatus Cloacimonadota bacterium]